MKPIAGGRDGAGEITARLAAVPRAVPRVGLLENERVLGVLLLGITLLLIVGPAAWLSGRGPEATARTAFWMAILPMVLAVPVGKGIAKPDFWSLEFGLPTFLATRPITNGQIVAAKMKAAALSTLLTWAVLLMMAPIALGLASGLTTLWFEKVRSESGSLLGSLSLWTRMETAGANFWFYLGKALFPELSYFTLFAPMAAILAVRPTGLFGRA